MLSSIGFGFSASGSGGGGGGLTSITANNGLTASTISNVQLGGSLIQNTTIANASFNLQLTGNPTADASWNSIFTINASGSGSGRSMIKLIGSGTTGVYLDNVSTALRGTTASSAITILGSGGGDIHNFTPATAFIEPIIKTFSRIFPSGTAINGDYVEILVRLSDPAIAGSTQTWYIDRLEYTDIVAGTAKYVKKIGSFVKASFNAHEINHLGQHTFNEYGVGNFTTGTAAYNLGVTATGEIIEVTAGGGGGSITADNGLTKASGNVQLGGTLIKNTTIAADTFTLTLSSATLASGYILNIENTNSAAFSSGGFNITTAGETIDSNVITASGVGSNALKINKSASGGSGILISVTASGASGVNATVTTGSAFQGQATSGYGGSFSTSTGLFALSAANTSGANIIYLNSSISSATLINEAVKINRGATGDGVGSAIATYINSSAGSSIASNYITKWVSSDISNRTSQFSIQLYDKGTFEDKFIINGFGSISILNYGSGSITGTAAYGLAVTATGEIIEVAIGGSGTVTSVDLSVPSPTNPAFSVSGNPVTGSGTLSISALGSTTQYIRGDGSLGNVTTVTTIEVTFSTTAPFDVPITASNAGTYSNESFSGAITDATFLINASPATLPFVVVDTDTLTITPNNTGVITLDGLQ